MGFLDNLIKNSVKKGVENAVGNAVRQAVEPAATNLANQAANSINQATQSATTQVRQTNGLEDALTNLQSSAENYATTAAKNMKICPGCEAPTTADKKFCPKCGTKLPDETVAQGAVCSNCGKQNSIGTNFCSDCGTKLPFAIAEEQREAERCDAVMSEWDAKLPMYPKWNCGGSKFNLEEYEPNCFIFSADFGGNSHAAAQAVAQYRQWALQHSFRPAGEYPNQDNLYNKINGICYHIDTEHAFDGDPDCPTIGFNICEPVGGFEYVKPQPKQKTSLKNLFGF